MINESPSFDIIVPVFNTKRELLIKCLESACNQSYSNYNVIVIDDGSKFQDTLEVLEFYKKKYSIRLITKCNSGSADARNMGLEHSKSDYFLFLDSDDYLNIDILSRLANILNKCPCDIIYFGLAVEENGKVTRKNIPSKDLTISDIITMSEKSLKIWGNSSVVAKCFSSKLRAKRFVNKLCYGEDKIYLFELYRSPIVKIETLSNIGYINVKNIYSMTRNYNDRSIELIRDYCFYFYNNCLQTIEDEARNYVCYKMLFESVVSLLNSIPTSPQDAYDQKMETIFKDTNLLKIISDSKIVVDNLKDKKIISAIENKKYRLARSYQNDLSKRVLFKIAKTFKIK